MTLATSS